MPNNSIPNPLNSVFQLRWGLHNQLMNLPAPTAAKSALQGAHQQMLSAESKVSTVPGANLNPVRRVNQFTGM